MGYSHMLPRACLGTPNPMIVAPTFLIRLATTAAIASQKTETQRLHTGMSDAEAYHAFASAAVDLASTSFHSISRSARDIDSNRRRTFLYHTNDEDNRNFAFPTEESDDVIWRTTSPSGQKMLVIRKDC
jgi:Zn-dependent M28 family amino/carboxypeptidase